MTATEPKTCGHEFNESTCSSGSFTYPDGVKTFHPSPMACTQCGKLQCDDCESCGQVCACCGGSLCYDCVNTARHRRVEECHALGGPITHRNEFMCAQCATAQDAAKLELKYALVASSANAEGDTWLAEIVDDLKEALRISEKAL